MTRAQLKEIVDAGLEIISIGSLYNGPWDKKYWSCSRGKDRYPYPIGYQAMRAHNGIKYKMEIHEGPKGPLFKIVTMDGHSFSGQTPDIAWEMFQRKGCLHMKIWHGKRSSCKVDGVEFFGFKNPFIQRLLREVVANVSGTPDLNLLPSNLCNKASESVFERHSAGECGKTDVHSCIERSEVVGKRSRRHGTQMGKPTFGPNLKRTRTQGPEINLDVSKLSSSVVVNKGIQSFGEDNDISNGPETALASIHLTSIENSIHANEGDDVFENSKSTQVADDLHIDEKSHDRLSMCHLGDTILEKETDGSSRDNPFQEVCANFDDNHHGVSVILETAPVSLEKNDLNQIDTASAAIISEELVIEPHPNEMCTLNTHSSPNKVDFDSVGQESGDMVKSMMTFLLPQAIPLLKKTSVKRQTTTSLETSCDGKATDIFFMETGDRERQESMCTDQVDGKFIVPCFDHGNSVVLDSLDDEQYSGDANIKKNLFSSSADADPAGVNEESIPSSSGRHVCGINDELLVYHLGTNERKASCNNIICENLNATCQGQDSSGRSNLTYSEPLKKEMIAENEVGGNVILPSSQVPSIVYSRRKAQNRSHFARESNNAHYETKTTSCLGKHFGTETSPTTESLHTSSTDSGFFHENQERKNLVSEPSVAEYSLGICSEKTTTSEAGLEKMCPCSPVLDQTEALLGTNKGEDDLGNLGKPFCKEQFEICVDMEMIEQNNLVRTNNYKLCQQIGTTFTDNCPKSYPQCNVELYCEAKDLSNIVGCYLHPMPVLSVFLSNIKNVIYICVLCGLPVDKNRMLFSYRVEMKEPRVGHPFSLGHTTATLPVLKDYTGEEIAVEQTGFQLTPDGSCLVILGGIKTPFCRAGSINCSCSTCTSDKFEQNVVKIVQVKYGYVSVVTSLKSTDSVHCVLTCQPDRLIAVGKGGRLHLWVMDSTWSEQTESYSIPSEDCISPNLVNVRRIPNHINLVVGHNGFGEFSLWDISKRVLMSRFLASSAPVGQFLPVSLFSWKRRENLFNNVSSREYVNELLDAPNPSSKDSGECSLLQLNDAALWLLVSTKSDSPVSHGYLSTTDCQLNQVGSWKLALLANNMATFGTDLDLRASAIGASAGQGIIGTHDGLVYAWELSTGNKLGTLLRFKGARVSCIATDSIETGAVAIAAEGRVLVYMLSSDRQSQR